MRTFEADIMGEEDDQRAFEQLVDKYGGKWWLIVQSGPGGGNPAYVFTLPNEQCKNFFREFNGEDLTAGKVIGEIPYPERDDEDYLPDFGVGETTEEMMRKIVTDPQTNKTEYGRKLAAVYRQILKLGSADPGRKMTADDALDLYLRAKNEADPAKKAALMNQAKLASSQLEGVEVLVRRLLEDEA